MDMEIIAARAVLKGAVQRKIQCDKSGRILDVRKAVLAEIHYVSGNVSDLVVHVDFWDGDIETRVQQTKDHPAVSDVRIYDGRELYARKSGRKDEVTK